MLEVVAALHLGLQPGFNGLVLVVEVGQVGHQVLHHEHVGQRVDLSSLSRLVDVAEASKSVFTIDIHGATAANTLTAGSAESQSRILLVLNFKKSVQHHRSTIIEVDRVGGHIGLLPHLFRVPTINFEVPAKITFNAVRELEPTLCDNQAH